MPRHLTNPCQAPESLFRLFLFVTAQLKLFMTQHLRRLLIILSTKCHARQCFESHVTRKEVAVMRHVSHSTVEKKMFEPQAGRRKCRLPNFIQCANLSCLLDQLSITLSILLLMVDLVDLYVLIPDPLFYLWHNEVLTEKRTRYICTIPCYICTPFLSLAKTLIGYW